MSCGLYPFSLKSLFDTLLVHCLSFLILRWVVFSSLLRVFLSVFPCSFYPILSPSVLFLALSVSSFRVSSISFSTAFGFSFIFLSMFSFIAYFRNFLISYFLLKLFFLMIASVILFTLLTSFFPIFYIISRYFCSSFVFTSFCCICCQLTTLNAHHFVVMPAQHVRPFPRIQCLYDQHFAAKLSKVVDRTAPPPTREHSLDGSFAINRS